MKLSRKWLNEFVDLPLDDYDDKAFAEAMAAEKASVSALIHPAEERAQVSAAQAIPAPMNREQRRAAVKAHPAMVDFRAQEAAKAARREAPARQTER